VTSPEDFNLSAIRQSPTGEYFVQALNDKQGIFTSMNGQDWTRQVLPVKQTLGDIQFFSDGTPLLKSDNSDHLIRRNGSWYTMDIGGYGNIQATFIKDDTLFAYQNDMFAYSLDKGKSFTTVFTSSQLIIDHTAHLWKFDHHFVLHHTAGASDSLSVYTENGVRVLYKGLNVGSPVFTYNSCGQVLINDASNYYLLKEQGLNYTSGLTKNIMNNYSSSSDLQSQGGNYYLRTGKTIFKSSGCNFSWTILENSDFISSYDNMWVNPQADIFLYDNRSDVFEEEPNGTNTWTEHTLDINYALVSSLDESTQDRQFAITSNALFRKNVSDPNWTELDSSANTGYQIQYAPNGDLYINRRSDILYSTDNGQSFSTITLPEDQILPGDYIMHVLDDHILFIIGGLLGQCYYTVNNGQDWIAVPLSFFIDLPKVKLVDNYILIADLDYAYDVYRIDLATNAVTSVHLGDYFPLDYYGSAILDDGTIYFQGFDTNGGHPDGLYRYRIGEGLHYLGAFDELIYLDELFSSGTDLLGFGSSEYYVL
ncbi:MAG TPA: hypothetical protein VJ508_16715, partial [Saprospiraceae bacterium]|nr:hypothetical protein [Saprospiraceae bacterium]